MARKTIADLEKELTEAQKKADEFDKFRAGMLERAKDLASREGYNICGDGWAAFMREFDLKPQKKEMAQTWKITFIGEMEVDEGGDVAVERDERFRADLNDAIYPLLVKYDLRTDDEPENDYEWPV